MNTTLASPITIRLSALKASWIILGILSAFRINVSGEVYLGEMAAVAMLPFVLLGRRVDRNVIYVLALAAVWSMGQFISDLINQTETNSMLKGVLAPVVFAATIATGAFVFDKYPRRMPSLLLGVALSLLLSAVFEPTPEQLFQPWKWGYGFAVLGIALVWLSFFKTRSIFTLVFTILAFSLVCILENARSLAMIPIAGLLAYLFWRLNVAPTVKLWLTGRFGALKMILMVVLATWLLNAALTLFFASGVLDPLLAADVAQKYRQQASTEVGLLLAGRSESIIAIRAYLDAPIIGHGSWAQDKSGYIDEWIMLLYRYGISDNLEGGGISGIEGNVIPSHSFLLGAMVWSGIAGGAFWLLFTFRVLGRYLRFAAQLPIYFHVGLVNFLWNLLFSPFGAQSRWALAVFIAALFAACAQLNRARNPTPPISPP